MGSVPHTCPRSTHVYMASRDTGRSERAMIPGGRVGRERCGQGVHTGRLAHGWTVRI